MAYTGHKNTRMPDGKTLVEWVSPTVRDECAFYGVEIPSDKQIAVVIMSLRMHTMMMHAAEYDYSELGHPEQKQEYWPMQSSIGRYFRDAPRITLEESP